MSFIFMNFLFYRLNLACDPFVHLFILASFLSLSLFLLDVLYHGLLGLNKPHYTFAFRQRTFILFLIYICLNIIRVLYEPPPFIIHPISIQYVKALIGCKSCQQQPLIVLACLKVPISYVLGDVHNTCMHHT